MRRLCRRSHTREGGGNAVSACCVITHVTQRQTRTLGASSCTVTRALPLWDEYSHPQHLLLEVLLVAAQRAPEEEEAGAVGLALTHTSTYLTSGTLMQSAERGIEEEEEDPQWGIVQKHSSRRETENRTVQEDQSFYQIL